MVQHAHVNPYRYVPGDIALKDLRDPNDDLFSNMNRRDYAHTIYPPVAQIVFFLVTTLNGSVTMMKLAMVLFEGLTLTGLTLLLRQSSAARASGFSSTPGTRCSSGKSAAPAMSTPS